MNATNILEILKYASKLEHPLFIGVVAGIIVFFLLRKFRNSEYITAGKQGYEELERRYKIISDALEESEKRCDEFERKFFELEQENLRLRSDKQD